MKNLARQVIWILVSAAALALPAAGQYPNRPRNRREAVGDIQAARVEALLQALYPGATIEWDPELTLHAGSGESSVVEMPGFRLVPQTDGTAQGVTALEIGTGKRDYLTKLGKFQTTGGQGFTTTIIAFEIDPSGRISGLKKVPLDPHEPLSEVESLDVRSWPSGGWPVVHVNYQSHIAGGNSLRSIVWDSLLDMSTGSLVARLPAGIFVTAKDGDNSADFFSIRRVNSSQIQITGKQSKKTLTYSCADPCVVDGPTLLMQWAQ